MSTLVMLMGVQLVHLLAVMSPGPSLLVVAQASVGRSRDAGIWTAAGLALGTLIWASSALFGLAVLFETAPWLYLAMKLAGAGYLFWLAFMLWRHASRPLSVPPPAPEGRALAGTALRRGLLTQLSNPKVAVFFGSIFITLLPPQPSAVMIAALLVIVCGNEFVWYWLMAHAFSSRRMRRRYGRLKALIDRLTGGVLAALGLKLVIEP